jgi:ribose transport system substrate-binding protein
MSSRRKWTATAVAGLVALSALAAGCGSDDNKKSSSSGGDKKTNVAFLSYSFTDYNQAEVSGIKQGLAANGGTVKVFNSNFDPQAGQKQCQDAISSGRYNAFVISTLTPPTGVPCVKAAKAAGIPVATIEQTIGTDPARTYDIKPQVDGVVAVNTYTLDTQIKASVELVKGACGNADPCNVVYETATANDPYSKDIISGVKKALPQVKVVATFTANYDPAGVVKAMPDILAAHPDTNVYLSAADSSGLAALPAIKAAGLTDQVKVVGNGGSTFGAKAIADGTMYGSNGNWPVQAGQQLAKALVQSVNGQEITNCCVDGLLVDTPLVLTKETVGDYTAEWPLGG